MKKSLAGGLAALGIAGTSLVVGIVPAFAQDEADGPETVLDELVVEGVITQDQADTVEERFEQWREENPRRHRGGPGGFFGGSESRQEILDLLGLDEETVRERLQAGETFADIAGDDLDAVVAILVEDAEERLATAVENGRLTQEEADAKAADLDTRIRERLESDAPLGGRGRGHRGPGRGFGHHFDGDAPDGAEDGALEGSSLTTS